MNLLSSAPSAASLRTTAEAGSQAGFSAQWQLMHLYDYPHIAYSAAVGSRLDDFDTTFYNPCIIGPDLAFGLVADFNRFESRSQVYDLSTFSEVAPSPTPQICQSDNQQWVLNKSMLESALLGRIPLRASLPPIDIAAFWASLPKLVRLLLRDQQLSCVEFLLRFGPALIKSWPSSFAQPPLLVHHANLIDPEVKLHPITVAIVHSNRSRIELPDSHIYSFCLGEIISALIGADTTIVIQPDGALLRVSKQLSVSPWRGEGSSVSILDLMMHSSVREDRRYVVVDPLQRLATFPVRDLSLLIQIPGKIYFANQSKTFARALSTYTSLFNPVHFTGLFWKKPRRLAEVLEGALPNPRRVEIPELDSGRDVIVVAFSHQDEYQSLRGSAWERNLQSQCIDADIDLAYLLLDSLVVVNSHRDALIAPTSFSTWLSDLSSRLNPLCIIVGSGDVLKNDVFAKVRAYFDASDCHWCTSDEQVFLNSGMSPPLAQARGVTTPFRLLTRGYLGGLFCASSDVLCKVTYRDGYITLYNLLLDISLQFFEGNHRPGHISEVLVTREIFRHPFPLEICPPACRDYGFTDEQKHENKLIVKRCESSFLARKSSLVGRKEPCTYHLSTFESPLITVIVPFKDQSSLTDECIKSIVSHAGASRWEIILVDNASTESKTHEWLDSLNSCYPHVSITVIHDASPFNFSALNNRAAEIANGDYILMVNNDIEVIAEGFMEIMLQPFAMQPVGIVGGSLLYPDHTIQHHGVVMVEGEIHDTICPGKGLRRDQALQHYGCFYYDDEWSAVTAAFLMIRTALYHQLNGMDETLQVAYNDVDLCLRARELGHAVVNISTPLAIHRESKSRGHDVRGDKYNRLYRESAILRAKHPETFTFGDVLYPPVLSRHSARPQLKNLPTVPLMPCQPALQHVWERMHSAAMEEMMIYVHYSADATVAEYVIDQVRHYAHEMPVFFVTTSPNAHCDAPEFRRLQDVCMAVLCRDNIGYDFGSWAAAIQKYELTIRNLKRLYLANDSCYGPFMPIEKMLQRIRASNADLIGLTGNSVFSDHVQSYFTVWAGQALHSPFFHHFWRSIEVWSNKIDIIRSYEVRLADYIRQLGGEVEVLYTEFPRENMTHTQWRELIDNGFPYVKVELLKHNPTGQDLDGCLEYLESRNPVSFAASMRHLRGSMNATAG